ncbi:MAG TPA: DUF423 domain-containing protein [Gemmatimonadaceae bacterium]|nr:DUF423 domain-containing protein [Gemmatimonadaceae bacterium]
MRRRTFHSARTVLMPRTFVTLGALSALLAVAAGAFGAHALRARLSPADLATFETGARYQMYHALALLAVAWAAQQWPGVLPRTAGWLFVVGTVLFSGSLYTLVLSGQRWLGAVTPLGGVAFLAGWGCLAAAALRARP